jgi:hypothetical protein
LLHDKDIHLSLLQRCQSRFETVLDCDFNQLCTDEIAKLEKESSILKEDIKNEVSSYVTSYLIGIKSKAAYPECSSTVRVCYSDVQVIQATTTIIIDISYLLDILQN